MSQENELGIQSEDFIAMLSRGCSGLIPIVGPFVAEVLGAVIPNQRADRFVKFLVAFEERVKKLEIENAEVRSRFNSPEYLDIFEDGASQAVKAFSGERLKYIACILSDGLKEKELNHLKTKKMLMLLSQVTDPEIIHLQFYYLVRAGTTDVENAFWRKHQALLEPKDNSFGMPVENFEDFEIQESYLSDLVNLKLLTKGTSEPPSVTFLGSLFLKSIMGSIEGAADHDVNASHGSEQGI